MMKVDSPFRKGGRGDFLSGLSYKIRKRIFTCSLALFLSCAGCAGIPFQTTARVPVESVHPEKARELFIRSLPSEFQMVNSVVFKYGWKTFSAIGYTKIDADEKKFTLMGLTPIGIKLFELSGTPKGTECGFAIKAFTRQGNFADRIADDIRRIYFDRIPSPEAKVCKKKYEIVFRDPGETEYIFAGADNVLIEKRRYEGIRRIWSVFYYEYQRKNGKLHPGGIIFRHYQHGYQLIIRLKEIRP
ncbi:DUF3261 domain-containing protein [Desulfococcaceae bacterium HSG8]|nr:DUF3261 domain-containing protein [Desulfococcaceae bacterium HSG8]